MIRFGVDLGGTKIEVIALDSSATEIYRQRIPTPQGNYAATVNAVAQLVRDAVQKVGVGGPALRVGVGIPGAESLASGLIKNANSVCLIGQALRADLQAALGFEVRLANDANCFALSEAMDGAASGADVVFGVILGTGVGGGIVVRGQVLTGTNSIAGEWGHNPIAGEEHVRPPCYCGHYGCIETFLSGPGLSADHRRIANADFSAAEINAQAANDSACEATLRRYELRLARVLAQVINILDPDVIVLGGGLSNMDRLYQNVPSLWGTHIFSDQVRTRLLKHHHGDSSGVRGAAWLWS